MTFNVSDFWPNPLPGQTVRFQYDGPVNLRSDFSTRDGLLICDDYVDNKWKDQWQIYRHPTRGVIEIGDKELNKGFEAFVCGPTKQLTYKSGKEIVWGGSQCPKDVIHSPIEVDRMASTGLGSIVDNAGNYGWQTVSFEEHYADILQIAYAQWWGKNPTPTGARYWLKQGVGPIGIAWLKPDGTYTPRISSTPKVSYNVLVSR